MKNTNTWKLNNTLLNNQEITEEIKEEIKKYLQTGGDPAPEPTGSLVGLMADSRRAHAKEYFPELLLPMSFSPQ